MARLPLPPVVASSREYGERLTDVGFWRPYVRAVLARHRLADPGGIEAGFAGTYPTFLVGGTVVKLFGALRHQFDLFAGVRDRLPLARYRSLDDLATAMWSVATGLR